MPPNRPRHDLAGELRPVLALARMDCAATLSLQVDVVAQRLARCPERVMDPARWVAALQRPARDLDDDWVRRCGPALRRAAAIGTFHRSDGDVTNATHSVSRLAGPILAAAATAALPEPSRRGGSRGARVVGSVLSGPAAGTLLPGALLSGSVLSGLAGAWRLLPGAGPGLLLVLCGLVLLAGAAVAARVRMLRAARAGEIATRVRVAVLAAADRELVRRSLDAEQAAGVPAPAVTGVRAALRRAGAGRAA